MAEFPALKTGAPAQYPLERQLRFSTRVLEFVDGREQRFREHGRALKSWVIRLDLLDESELEALAHFFETGQSAGRFTFMDPADGSAHTNCVLEGTEFLALMASEGRASAEIRIREDAE